MGIFDNGPLQYKATFINSKGILTNYQTLRLYLDPKSFGNCSMICSPTRYLALIAWMLVMIPNAWATPLPDTLRLSEFAERISLRSKAQLLTASPSLTWAQARMRSDWQAGQTSLTTSSKQAYWLRTLIHNDSDSLQSLFVYSANVHQSVTFYLSIGGVLRQLQSGNLTPTPEWSTDENDLYVRFEVPPQTSLELYVRIANKPGWLPTFTGIDTPRPSLMLSLEKAAYHYRRSQAELLRNLPELSYRTWIQGALGFCVIFVGLIYWRYRMRIYRYYWLYILGAFGFAVLKTRSYTPLGHWLSYYPMLRTHLLEVAMWGSLGAYVFFLNELLDLGRLHPPTYRWLRRIGWGLIGYGVLYGLVMLLTNDGGFHQFTYWGVRFVAIPLNVGIILWIALRLKPLLWQYVVWGNVLMASVGVMAWLRGGEVLLKGVKLPASLDDLFTVSFGVLLEILVFSLALAHRIRLIDDERQANQRAYIRELEQKSSYEKRLAEIEMLALRSQMNPHFLFNSLNSLEYFILAGEEQKATQYLSKFSRLLRLILNHSREETITLAEELTALRLYLEIEATRFGEDFKFSIEISQDIAQEHIVIPPLLLQPFVENAIWHGLMQSHQHDKRLEVSIVAQSDKKLLMEIRDNGIGRQQAAHLKSKSVVRHKSHGMEITSQRIELFNRSYPSKISIEVLDLQQHKQSGTLVRIAYQLEDIPQMNV